MRFDTGSHTYYIDIQHVIRQRYTPIRRGIAFVVAPFRRRQGTRAARPGSFITSFPMVAFGRNIATGKELKSFGGGIWKRYCNRRGTQVFQRWHLEAILQPTRNSSLSAEAFGSNIATDEERWPSAKSIWSPLAILRPRPLGPFGAGQPFAQFPLA